MPSLTSYLDSLDLNQEGSLLHKGIAELYPLCRSITGDGLRQSLRYLQERVPLDIYEVPSGTRVLDWTVPDEWNIRDAWIRNARGEKVVDYQQSNLHVMGYSQPIQKTLPLSELKQHLFSLPEKPDWIPYRTSYYQRNWGFCLSHHTLQSLSDGDYEVCIDSTLEPGSLSYGELLLKGNSEEEVLLSCHSCHPSLANDNLSGMIVGLRLAEQLAELCHRYSYRFLWAPGTIGAIAWLARNEGVLSSVKHGLVLSCVGDPGAFTYKRSRRGNSEIDRTVSHVLGHSGHPYQFQAFSPIGYDERQYCSPGFNLPVGCFMRTPNGQYPEYHTSADDLELVKPAALGESMTQLLKVIEALELDQTYVNLFPRGEPQLGCHGLYHQTGGTSNPLHEQALLWVLNFSDGSHSLLDIAERSGLELRVLAIAASRLVERGLCRLQS